MVDELGVYYNTAAIGASVRGARRALLWRLAIPVVFAVAVCIVWAVSPGQAGQYAPWFLVVFGVFALGSVIWDLLRLRAVNTDATRVVGGLALGLNRDGALVGQSWFGWADVATMVLRRGRFGSSDRLIVTGRDQRSEWLPIAYTDAVPGWLDSVVRALSGGRVAIDWSRLDV